MDILKVALIGAGKHGVQGYIPVIKTMADEFQLTAIYDLDEEVAASVGQQHGIHAYTNLESLFENEQLDFCVITVPAHLKQHVALEVVQFDISFLMAAPIAVDLPSADQIARMGRIHNIKIEVAEHYYRQPHEAIKRLLIQEGTFGEIQLIADLLVMATTLSACCAAISDLTFRRCAYRVSKTTSQYSHTPGRQAVLNPLPSNVGSMASSSLRGDSVEFTILPHCPTVHHCAGIVPKHLQRYTVRRECVSV